MRTNGSLTVYKEGEVLTGATRCQRQKWRLSMKWEDKKEPIYNVYAEADIVAADGTTVYQKGALVKENLITGEDGSATLENLHVGTYTVTEMQAPDTLVCTGESKTVTLTAGEHAEVQVRSVSFTNDRQKASVSLVKQDGDTQKPLSGAFFDCMQETISLLLMEWLWLQRIPWLRTFLPVQMERRLSGRSSGQ